VEEGSVDFLRLILPAVDRMRESAAVLSRSSEHDQHFSAAYDLLDGLCQSIRMFPSVGLPRLLGSNDPMPLDRYGDLAWLMDVGYHLDEILHRQGLTWPPPGQRDPPAIVQDLREMYSQLASRHLYLKPVTRESLLTIVEPVGMLACRFKESVETIWVPLERTGNASTFAKIAKRLGFGIATLATGIGILQGPATINEFPDEWVKFTQRVDNIVNMAANNVIDITHDLEEELGRSANRR
jgi:hypothetical protein